MLYREPIQLNAANGSREIKNTAAEAITGKISIARSSKHRSLDISLTYRPVSADGQAAIGEQTCFFEMGVSG